MHSIHYTQIFNETYNKRLTIRISQVLGKAKPTYCMYMCIVAQLLRSDPKFEVASFKTLDLAANDIHEEVSKIKNIKKNYGQLFFVPPSRD
jgi:hypothetical protein